jgi:Tol biopolymer transport system component
MRRAALLVAAVLALGAAAPLSAQEPDAILYSAYRYGGRRAGAAIFTIVPGEQRVRLTGGRSFNLEPVWSPDRTRVAYVHHARPRNPDVWVMDADGSDKARLTTGRRDDTWPQWSPDGTQIAWSKSRADSAWGELYVMNADGTEKRLVVSGRTGAARWSPDGSRIAYTAWPGCEGCDTEIRVVDPATGETRAIADGETNESSPGWSPDGSRIVFSRATADEESEIFTVAADGTDERQLTSTGQWAFLPRWSPTGEDVAFTLIVDGEDFHTRLGVVSVASGEERLLTDVPTGGVFPDWSPDGTRIAFLGFHSGGYNVGVIGADGAGLTQVTDSDIDEAWVDW